jgi:outer membrane protein assembly factor BamB
MAALINGVATAAPGDFLFRLTAPEPQEGALFGDMVRSVDGDILISEPNRLFVGTNARGHAYLFDGMTGQMKWVFKNPDQMDLDDFAESIAGGDGRIFISTGGLEERVYAFNAITREPLYRIENPHSANINFGSNLGYGDGSVVVSAPSYSLPGMTSVGRAYLFEAATGNLRQTVPNPEPKAGDVFGGALSSLAVVENMVFVGAHLDDLPSDTRPDGDNPGRVWSFDASIGAVRFTLENPNAQNQLPPFFFADSFGASVAAGAGLVVVGARTDSTSGIDESGTAYVFDAETGALTHTLFSPQPERVGRFGHSVAVTSSGDVLVGAYITSVNGIAQAGHAYLFDGETGNLLLDIAHPEPTSGDIFGWSVWSVGDRIVVGAPNANPLGPATGAVYVFEGIPEARTVMLGLAGLVVTLISYRVRAKRIKRLCKQVGLHPTLR